MRRTRTIAIILVIVLAFGLLVGKRLKERRAEKAKLDESKPAPTRVVGTHPSQDAMRETVKAAGSIAARAQVIITPKVSGRISRLVIEEGAYVRPGQVLAEIEHVELSAQLAQAQASVGSAQAAISQGKINLISAQTDEKRMKTLIDQQAIPQQQYDAAVTKTALAKQSIEAAQAQLAQANATVRFNEAQISNYIVTAPIGGQITHRNVDAGAMASAGVELFTLAQTGSLRAEFDLPERQLAKLFRGQAVLVASTAEPDKPVRAALTEISPVVDPQSRLVKVKVDVPSGGVFRPGLSVQGEFVLTEKPTAISVPLEAVSVANNRASVLIEDHGKVAERAVVTGIRSLTRIEILSGLAPSDTVIVAGQTFVKSGDLVSVDLGGTSPAATGSETKAEAVPPTAPTPSAKGA